MIAPETTQCNDPSNLPPSTPIPMTIGSSAPFDDFYDRNRGIFEMMRQMQQLQDAMAPALAIQESMKRQQEIADTLALPALFETARSLRQQQDIVDSFVVPSALNAAADSLRRQADILGALRNSPAEELARTARLMDDAFGGPQLEALKFTSPLLELLKTTPLQDEMRKWFELESARSRFADEARFASAAAGQAFDAARFSTVFAEALVEQASLAAGGGHGRPENLLDLAMRVGSVVAQRFPGINRTAVLTLVVSLIVGALGNFLGGIPQYELAKRNSDVSTEHIISSNHEIVAAVDRAAAPRSFTAATTVNLRERPERKGKLTARLAAGTELTEYDRDGHWRFVKVNGQNLEGWVYAGSLIPNPPSVHR